MICKTPSLGFRPPPLAAPSEGLSSQYPPPHHNSQPTAASILLSIDFVSTISQPLPSDAFLRRLHFFLLLFSAFLSYSRFFLSPSIRISKAELWNRTLFRDVGNVYLSLSWLKKYDVSCGAKLLIKTVDDVLTVLNPVLSTFFLFQFCFCFLINFSLTKGTF